MNNAKAEWFEAAHTMLEEFGENPLTVSCVVIGLIEMTDEEKKNSLFEHPPVNEQIDPSQKLTRIVMITNFNDEQSLGEFLYRYGSSLMTVSRETVN